jgi:hypothetical protein
MRRKLVDCTANAAGFLMLGGLTLCLASRHLGGFGALTGWMAMWLGTCGAIFRQGRHEPGLWRLSGLFLTMTLPLFAALSYGSISDVAQARALSLSACDLCGANFFLAVQVLYLAVVTRTNWSLRKKPAIPEL